VIVKVFCFICASSHPSVLWRCWLGHLTRKIVSEMTYNVSSETLNTTIPYHLCKKSVLFLCFTYTWINLRIHMLTDMLNCLLVLIYYEMVFECVLKFLSSSNVVYVASYYTNSVSDWSLFRTVSQSKQNIKTWNFAHRYSITQHLWSCHLSFELVAYNCKLL